MLEGFCCFSFPFFCLFLGGGGYYWKLLEFCQILIKDIFTNTVSFASAKHFVFAAIMHSFLMALMSLKLKTPFLYTLYIPICLF